MPRTEVPLIPVFTRSSGSWRDVVITARVIKAGIGALTFADASLDLVSAAHVLQHLSEPVAALALMRHVLRFGGWVMTCVTRHRRLPTWRIYRRSGQRVVCSLGAGGLDATELDEPPRHLFRLTRLTAIEHKASAGIAGKELNP